ncbi:GEMI8 protein, partial [Nothoprocta ornata]|nr:GEMI8 protein [Nothoprocta pentlandii]NWY04516.1 GEMI8 protein [Nothoprocta ornata]
VIQEAMPVGEAEPWYLQRVYARYWRHYDAAMRWMRKHHTAYGRAMEASHRFPWLPAPPSSRYSDWECGDPGGDGGARTRGPSGRAARASRTRQRDADDAVRDPVAEEGAESEEEVIECDLSNMEITEELREFFAQTERHREELRKQQQLEAEYQEEYVDADHDFHMKTGRSVQPPTERPGERQMAEMKKLYGDSAAKIHAMETAMQLDFDRNCDKYQPKYWPIIPLKL